jgi:hypothetical protein
LANPRIARILSNPYYAFFVSDDGDEVTARSLLPTIRTKKQTSDRPGPSPQKKRLPNPTSSDSDYDDMTFHPASPGVHHHPSAAQAFTVSDADPKSAHSAKERDTDDPNSWIRPDRRRLRTMRSRYTPPDVDITALKPRTAELVVKYEKVFRVMKHEDDEFFKFRESFFQRLASSSRRKRLGSGE